MPRIQLFALVLIAALASPASAAEAEVVSAEVIAIDGQRYRLVGIDAPEEGQRCWLKSKLFDCAEIAKAALIDLVTGGTVICKAIEPPETTEDGLPVALCRSDGYDLSEGMTYTGWALAIPAGGSGYRAFEEGAREAGRGLWRGRFIQPWAWRGGARLPEELEN